MIRARPGRRFPRSLPPVLVLLLAAAVGACAPTSTATATPPGGTGSPTPPASGSGAPPTSAPGTPTPGSSDAQPTAGPTASGPAPTGSAACSGNDDNRSFYALTAAAMTWSVYCPVLPDGWYVLSGSYRLADGGHMNITYRGPGGAQLSLAEGNVCADAGTDVDACAPRDSVIGNAPMGDQTGELGRLSTGFVMDVDRGANPSWRVTGFGLSEDDFRAICAAMVLVPA